MQHTSNQTGLTQDETTVTYFFTCDRHKLFTWCRSSHLFFDRLDGQLQRVFTSSWPSWPSLLHGFRGLHSFLTFAHPTTVDFTWPLIDCTNCTSASTGEHAPQASLLSQIQSSLLHGLLHGCHSVRPHQTIAQGSA